PKWLSTNLGILTCIECSGIHREMGVHISRIQSMELDKLGTSELLLAKNVGNSSFNEIMEANLTSPSPKPSPSSDMTVRKEFINAKYVDHKYAKKTCTSAAAKLIELFEAIQTRDLLALIQVYAEGVELMEPLPEAGPVSGTAEPMSVCDCAVFDGPLQEAGETALHYAVRTADQTSLHLVDFLVQNRVSSSRFCQYARISLKLVQAAEGKFNPHIHVEYEWSLRLEEMDESDDDLDDKVMPQLLISLWCVRVSLQPSPIKKDRSPRPQSFCHSSSLSPHDKLSLPGFITQRDKQQRLSYSAFTNQMYSASTDLSSSPVADGPPLPPRNQGKGQTCLLQQHLRPLFPEGFHFYLLFEIQIQDPALLVILLANVSL
ncbi:Arf-GAP with SH3 domain, ANK repeat and PH domain-containing protein 1, partial [Xenoophorus captivus]